MGEAKNWCNAQMKKVEEQQKSIVVTLILFVMTIDKFKRKNNATIVSQYSNPLWSDESA